MSNLVYIAEYIYIDDINELKAEFRPAHREFMRKMHDDGIVLATGRIDAFNISGSMTLVKAASGQQVRDMLSDDPYIKGGLVKQVIVRAWTPVVGTYS